MISKESWTFINTFAPWFSAFGTILAVIVSLYLALSERRIKIKINVSHNIVVSENIKGPFPEVLSIYVTNTWHRPVTITSLYWKCGIVGFRKFFYIKPPFEYPSNQLPVVLKEGEYALFHISYNPESLDNCVKNIVQEILYPFFLINFLSLKLVIITSVGKTFSTRVEKSLRNLIKKENKNLQNITYKNNQS